MSRGGQTNFPKSVLKSPCSHRAKDKKKEPYIKPLAILHVKFITLCIFHEDKFRLLTNTVEKLGSLRASSTESNSPIVPSGKFTSEGSSTKPSCLAFNCLMTVCIIEVQTATWPFSSSKVVRQYFSNAEIECNINNQQYSQGRFMHVYRVPTDFQEFFFHGSTDNFHGWHSDTIQRNKKKP